MTADGDGQRECARGTWCAGRTSETVDGKIVTTPAWTYRPFCEKDEGIIGGCLESVPGVWSRLHKALGDRIVTEVLIRMPFGPSEPISLGVEALLRLLALTMRTWEARTRAAAGLLAPDQSVEPVSAESVAESARTMRLNLSVLLALQPAWMSRTIPLRPGRLGLPPRITDEIEAEHGDEEIVRIGVDFLTLWTASPEATSAATAGNEIMRLEHAGRAVLLETPAKAEDLLGVPCRATCYPKRTLIRADPAQHDGDPEFWSHCPGCGDYMTAEEYKEWVKLNHAHYKARTTPALSAAC